MSCLALLALLTLLALPALAIHHPLITGVLTSVCLSV